MHQVSHRALSLVHINNFLQAQMKFKADKKMLLLHGWLHEVESLKECGIHFVNMIMYTVYGLMFSYGWFSYSQLACHPYKM